MSWVDVLPHDSLIGVRWSRQRAMLEMHDPETGEVVDLYAGKGVPDWVRRELDRVRDAQRVRPPTTFHVSGFRSLTNTEPVAREYAWPRLVEWLTTWRTVPAKEALPLWSPALFNGTRSKAATAELSCLVLDYDDGETIEAALRKWGRWRCLVHTSFRHTPEAHKFRLVLPLAVPVLARDWPRVWAWAERVSARKIDAQAKDCSRAYYLFGGAEGGQRHVRVLGDRPVLWIDVHKLPEVRPVLPPAPPAPPVSVPANQAVREFQDRLKTDPDSRRRAGEELGGRLTGEYVREVRCPRCGRNSVWWPVVPVGTPQALCSHRNSCGWNGWIDQLFGRVAA